MKEPQTVHSHRGPESAGARWILRCAAPQKEEGGLPIHPSSPVRGCDRASPRAGGERRGSPGSPCLRAKGLAPQALAPHLQVRIWQVWGQGTRGKSPSTLSKPRVTIQRAASHHGCFMPQPSSQEPPHASLCLNQPLSAFAGPSSKTDMGTWTGPKSPLGRGESAALQCWASGVLPAATPVTAGTPRLGPAREGGACTPNGWARGLLKAQLLS